MEHFNLKQHKKQREKMVEGEGFEPSKAEPSDLQSDPFGHSGTPPTISFFTLFLSYFLTGQEQQG
jgi:hypothetical protein